MMIEAEISMMRSEDEGRGHKPRCRDGLLQVEKDKEKTFSPKSFQKEPALPTL